MYWVDNNTVEWSPKTGGAVGTITSGLPPVALSLTQSCVQTMTAWNDIMNGHMKAIAQTVKPNGAGPCGGFLGDHLPLATCGCWWDFSAPLAGDNDVFWIHTAAFFNFITMTWEVEPSVLKDEQVGGVQADLWGGQTPVQSQYDVLTLLLADGPNIYFRTSQGWIARLHPCNPTANVIFPHVVLGNHTSPSCPSRARNGCAIAVDSKNFYWQDGTQIARKPK